MDPARCICFFKRQFWGRRLDLAAQASEIARMNLDIMPQSLDCPDPA